MIRFPVFTSIFPAIVPACLAAACLAVAGCEPAPAPTPRAQPAVHDHAGHAGHADHDHAAEGGHKHPETLAAGLAELETTWAEVKSALAAGEHEKADDRVHMVGHLLEDLEGLLAKATPAAEAEAAGKKALEEIFACFDTLDAAVHEGPEAIKKVDMESLGGRIGEAVKSLKELAK
jgi:hypothetical protein